VESLINFIQTSFLDIALPALIAITLVGFTTFGKKLLERSIESKFSDDEGESKERNQFEAKVDLLVKDEETTIELLEEIWEVKGFWFFKGNTHLFKLHGIVEALQNTLRENIGKDDFAQIKNKAMSLIKEAKDKIDSANELEPFDGLGEPEKSLLMDLLEVIPDEKEIPRQKTIQLADIIKVKHQEMLQLQKDNAKSSAWTKWGTAGTVFFGILSIVLSIYLTK